MLLSEVGGTHLGPSRDLVRVARGDAPTEVEHHQVVRRGEDHVEVVLDEHDRHSLRSQVEQQVPDLGDLGVVHAGDRLVEQQDPGTGCQRTGDLNASLNAVGQRVGLEVPDRVEVELAEQVVDELTS